MDSISGADPMKLAHADSPETQLNVYVVNIDFGGPAPIRGFATFPWDEDATGPLGGIVIDPEAFGTRPGKIKKVLTHEIGHALGLWHTFTGGTLEVTSRSACPDPNDSCTCPCREVANRTAEQGDCTGDFCSDTPATPDIPSDCDQPSCCDLCVNEPWPGNVDRNHMAIKADRDCPNQFTDQQDGRMHCWTCDRLSGWMVGASDAGACCLPDGTCKEYADVCCQHDGGLFVGEATTCSATTGACCTFDLGCVIMSQSCCAAYDGAYLGDATTCEGDPKACCDPFTGMCVDTFESCCDALGGNFESWHLCAGPFSCPTYSGPEPGP